MYIITKRILKNKSIEKAIPVITFDDPNRMIVAEFLMSDSLLLGADLLCDIDLVLAGEKPFIKTTGNRCGLYIKKDSTVINDLFGDMGIDTGVLPSYEINTMELKELILIWKKEYKKMETRE